MSNPYQAPKAAVDDIGGELPLPRTVHALRVAAITGNVLLLLIPALNLFSSRRPGMDLLLFSLGILLVGVPTILALILRVAGRRLFWIALPINMASLAFLLLGAYLSTRDTWALFVFILPFTLNIAAVVLVHRVRTARAGRIAS